MAGLAIMAVSMLSGMGSFGDQRAMSIGLGITMLVIATSLWVLSASLTDR